MPSKSGGRRCARRFGCSSGRDWCRPSSTGALQVLPLSTAELEQIYARRVVVEAVAVRTGTPHFSAAELKRLAALLVELESFSDPASRIVEWERPHREFHELLVAHAGESIVEDLRRLRDHSERYRAILGKDLPTSFGSGAREHREIVEACRAGDKARAGRLLGEHLGRSGMALIAQTDPAHDNAALREALIVIQASAPAAG